MWRFYVLAMLCVAVVSNNVCAGTPAEMEARMDEIRLDETYIFAEGLSSDAGTALSNALSDLAMAANSMRGAQAQPLTGRDLQGDMKRMEYTDGGRTVILLYIEVDKVKTMTPGERITVNIGGDAPQSSPAGSSSSSLQTQQSYSTPSGDEVLAVLKEIGQMDEMLNYFKHFKQLGKISDYGGVRNLADIPGDAFVVVYDRLYAVKSIISPKNSNYRINHLTNQPDSETNYSGHGVMWYK